MWRPVIAAVLLVGCSNDQPRMLWVTGKIELFSCTSAVVATSCSSSVVVGFRGENGQVVEPSVALRSVGEFNGRRCFVFGPDGANRMASENGATLPAAAVLEDGALRAVDSNDYLTFRCEAD